MTGERVSRRLAAIVAADVVGYSRLMEADEAGTLARLKQYRRDLIDPKIAEHGGRIVKTTGDGLLIEFASAVDGIRCAIEMQTRLAGRNANLPELSRLVFRIGINLGDVIVDGDDIHGDGVNIAARLESQAPAGGILVAGAVRDAVSGRLEATFTDLGRLTLKNMERSVRAFVVNWDPADWQPSPVVQISSAIAARPPPVDAPPALPEKPSMVVLPFENLSGDPEQQYFADGIVEEITTVLSRLRWLFVIARTSAFAYKGRTLDLRQVGRELGVRYVLEGSVRKAAKRVRITAQLIDAASGAHLWADHFDGELEEIFELHDRIAMEVAGAVEPSLREAETDRSLRKPTANLDAYDFYLRASSAFSDPSADNMRASFDLAQKALDLDPHYARALAHQAACILHSVKLFGPQAIPEALRLARAALAVSGDDCEATSLAAITTALMGGNIETALAASERALALNPNGYLALMHGGWVQTVAGQPGAAIEKFMRCLRFSPRDLFRGYVEAGLAVAYRDVGQPESAVEWGRRAMLSLPRLSGGYRAVAVALADLGRMDEAREVIQSLRLALPQARIDSDFVYRQNRNAATANSWIAALRQAGLPE